MTSSAHDRPGTSGSGRGGTALSHRARSWAQWAVVLAAIGVFALAARPVGAQDAEQPETQQAQGASLYLQHCSSCHGIQGNGTFRGPTLIGVGAASADYWVRSGRMPLLQPDQEAKRGEPAFSDEEIRALVDHVAAFGEGPPIPELDLATADLATGGELYRLNCASCHNWDGKGGALIGQRNAPPLHPAPNRQVAEAIRIGPGSMPQFTSGQLDDKELNDVVAYVDYLRAPRDAGGYGLAHWGPSTETIAAFVGMLVLVLVTVWLGERRG